MNYCIQLSETLQVTSNQVKEAWAEPPEGGYSLVPGQWVMIHKPQRLALEAKYEGPYQILLVILFSREVSLLMLLCHLFTGGNFHLTAIMKSQR